MFDVGDAEPDHGPDVSSFPGPDFACVEIDYAGIEYDIEHSLHLFGVRLNQETSTGGRKLRGVAHHHTSPGDSYLRGIPLRVCGSLPAPW